MEAESRTPYQRVLSGEEVLYFNHVPKTAGTSFYTALENNFAARNVCPWKIRADLTEQPRANWQDFQLYRGHFGMHLTDVVDRDPIMVTLVRSPLCREISSVHHGLRDPRRHDEVATLNEFVQLPDAKERMGHAYRNCFVPAHPEHGYDKVTIPEWQARAKAALDRCRFVGVTERFDDSLALLAFTMGWPLVPGERHNVKPTLQREELTEATMDFLRRITEPMESIYQYAVERFERDMRAMHSSLLDDVTERRWASIPPADELLLRFDEPIVGSGWHHCDVDEHSGSTQRWTGPGAESTLDVKVTTETDLDLRAHLSNAVTQCTVESLRLFVNDVDVPLNLRSLQGRHVLAQARVPREVLRRDPIRTKLRWQVAKTQSWHDLDPSSLDEQRRGVAFCQLLMSPCLRSVASGPAGATAAR